MSPANLRLQISRNSTSAHQIFLHHCKSAGVEWMHFTRRTGFIDAIFQYPEKSHNYQHCNSYPDVWQLFWINVNWIFTKHQQWVVAFSPGNSICIGSLPTLDRQSQLLELWMLTWQVPLFHVRVGFENKILWNRMLLSTLWLFRSSFSSAKVSGVDVLYQKTSIHSWYFAIPPLP